MCPCGGEPLVDEGPLFFPHEACAHRLADRPCGWRYPWSFIHPLCQLPFDQGSGKLLLVRVMLQPVGSARRRDPKGDFLWLFFRRLVIAIIGLRGDFLYAHCWSSQGPDNSPKGRPDLAHDKTSFVCGAGLCRSGLPGLSAGCQGFRRYDRNRAHELRSLAVYARASLRGNRLDLRFLDGTQLRCCSK